MNAEIIEKTIKNLRKHHFKVHYFEQSEDAVDCIVEQLKQAKSISRGGSVSVESLGLLEKIKELSIPFTDYKSWDERLASTQAEYYLTSSNAITEDGTLVNIDGCGNRVAAICFGPQKVFIVVGTNKIVPDYQAAIDRIKTIAAPKNTVRLKKKTPCAINGKCSDCNSEDRICRVTVITDRPYKKDRIHIYLINQNLGY